MEPFDLGVRLRSLREERKMTQEDVANRIGVQRQAVYKYENNINEPSVDAIKQLARVFNTDPNYLIGFSDEAVSAIYIDDLSSEQQDVIKDVVARLRNKFEMDNKAD